MEKKQIKSFLYKLGMVLLLLAVLCWVIVAIAPFTPFSLAIKTGVVTGSTIIGEIFFWLGAVFVGKEVVARYKRYLNPKNWRRNRERKTDDK